MRRRFPVGGEPGRRLPLYRRSARPAPVCKQAMEINNLSGILRVSVSRPRRHVSAFGSLAKIGPLAPPAAPGSIGLFESVEKQQIAVAEDRDGTVWLVNQDLARACPGRGAICAPAKERR